MPRPNVIIVLTDDQGYGDLSCHGNPVLKTPNLDRLQKESIRFTDFHVAPMCTPTRCELMTGRDSLTGGACFVDGGRAMMRTEYPTLAEVFSEAGYRTGLFGKWHLGDNYPYRPEDRGFEEVVCHRAWGITSVPDYWLNDYFDDRYWHNGEIQSYDGYCTDVWFREAMDWMRQRHAEQEPFLAYIATNAPHDPLFVGDDFRSDYGDQSKALASFFGMIACIDANMGRLERMLEETGLRENTMLIYMTDNGGTIGVETYNAGMRGRKTDLYEGGHRVPCFVRWPGGDLRSPGNVGCPSNVQDIFPTLLEACDISRPDVRLDGSSLLPVMCGEAEDVGERTLVVQYGCHHNRPFETQWFGDPHKWDAAVMRGSWRLVFGNELYDVAKDPAQTTDIAEKHPEVVAELRACYENWWAGRESHIFDWCYIPVGVEAVEEVCLTSHTWLTDPVTMQSTGGPQNGLRYGTPKNGPWNISVEKAGDYEIALRRWPKEAGVPIRSGVPQHMPTDDTHGPFPAGKALPVAKARIEVGDVELSQVVEEGDEAAAFRVALPAGRTRLQSWFYDADGNALCGAYYAYVRLL
ncbi:MAG: arylsulfatase [Candidatus Sumerlaeota bacterium]